LEADAYRQMADTEDRHWWFAARRRILRRSIRRLGLPSGARILEIGAGTGGNLAMLSGFGTVTAVEESAEARNFALEKTGIAMLSGNLPGGLPRFPGKFDLVCLFDVLEHIEDDLASLAAIRALLNEGGRLVLTVPAYQWLWSRHDEILHHKRRYIRKTLLAVAARAGLKPVRVSHFNFLLLPLLVAGRIFDRWRGEVSGHGTPALPLNSALREIFSSEAGLLDFVNLPFGASIYAEFVPAVAIGR
jgi:SAM-dependent methyltransferase